MAHALAQITPQEEAARDRESRAALFCSYKNTPSGVFLILRSTRCCVFCWRAESEFGRELKEEER